MDLGDRLEGERVPQQAALARLVSTCCGRVRRLASAGELARTEQRGSSLAEQVCGWSRLRRCRAKPLSLRLGIVAVPLQSIPEPGANDQGDAALGAVRKLRRRSCQLQRARRTVGHPRVPRRIGEQHRSLKRVNPLEVLGRSRDHR